MAGKQGVDPRFDPRFQRGFEGKVEAPPPPNVVVPAVVAPSASRSAEAAAESQHAAPIALPDPEPLRRFNPFRLALLLGSLATIGGALWLTWFGVEHLSGYYGSGSSQWMTFVASLVGGLPAPLFTAGLLGVVLWLGVGIVAPRRSREDD